tara:strand:- start:2697 stop:3464 length:768 start_codon:yes stop_codon:yes gene_type:complete
MYFNIVENYSKFKTFYDAKGYCHIKRFLSKSETKLLDQRVKKFINIKSKKLKGRNINFSKNNSINTLHDVDKFENSFKKFAKKSKNLKLASFFLKSKAQFRKCEIFAKPAKSGMASPMHQDNFLWAIKNNNGLTFWIALDHSNKKNGGLSYLAGSHKLGLLNHENSYMAGTSQKVKMKILKSKCKKLKKITPNLKPGDMLVHHCLIIHGSSANKTTKSRRGFTIQYKDKNSKYDKTLLSNYEKNLKKQLKLRNQI